MTRKRHIQNADAAQSRFIYSRETWTRVFSEPDVNIKRIKQVVLHNQVDFEGKVEGQRPFVTLCEAMGQSEGFKDALNFALRNNQPLSWAYSRKESVLYHLGCLRNQDAINMALYFGVPNGRHSRVNRALQLSAGLAPGYHEVIDNLEQFSMEPFDLRLSIKELSDYVRKLSKEEQREYFSNLSVEELKMRFEFTSDHTQFTYAIEQGFIADILTPERDPEGLKVLFNSCGKHEMNKNGFTQSRRDEIFRQSLSGRFKRRRPIPKLI